MTKKYIHTTLGRKAELIDKEEDVYCFVDDDANEHNFYGNELCSLGFIEAPTEEVKGDGNMQPIQDWITDAFNDYDKNQKSDSNNIRWKRGRFRASIKKFMPKPVEQRPAIAGETISGVGKDGVFMISKIDEVVDKIITSIAMNYDSQSSTQSLREAIKLHISTLQSPVEQELIPLDVEQIRKDLHQDFYEEDKEKIIAILSKYGVPKQEESFEEKFGKLHGTLKRCNCTPLTATEAQVIQREREHELIQAYEKGRKDVSDKKFTKQYVREKMSEFPCVTSYIINQTYKFLEKEGLLSD